jgi:hypothetical protein
VRKVVTQHHIPGGLLLAGCLAGCTPQFYSQTERPLACPYTPTQAVTYAAQAAQARSGTILQYADPSAPRSVQSGWPDGDKTHRGRGAVWHQAACRALYTPRSNCP